MSDSKISDLPAATTPLAGTELLEVVQTGANKKVAASDVGRLYTAGPGLVLSDSQFRSRVPYGDPERVVFWDDFLGSAASLRASLIGSGSHLDVLQGEIPGAVGAARFGTGTTNTGLSSVMWPHNNPAAAKNIYFGLGTAMFSTRVRVENLSDGTNTYSLRAGFTTDPGGDGYYEVVDALYFQYLPATRGNGNWWIISRNNYTERAVDSGVAFTANTWQVLTIEINAAATAVVSKIDGVTVDTNAANIPVGSGRRTGWGMGIRKSAGTTERRLLADYIHIDLHFPGGRP